LQHIDYIEWSHDYAVEQGYDEAPARGFLFGNWNYFSRKAADLLERAGYALEWSDEWTTCSNCNKALRTSPDSYDWQPAYTQDDSGIYCFECTDWQQYLESLEDNPHTACFARCNPAEYGYVRLSEPGEYENGYHSGQNDNPQQILTDLHKQGKRHIIFRIPEKSQFYISFEVGQRTPEHAKDEGGAE
jgi:hypothetical protein